MSFRIRPFKGDFDGILPLVNSLNPAPMTAEQLEQAHARFPADGLRHRMVAVDASGRIIGYASTSFQSWHKPGRFFALLVTAPDARRQGVGSALLAEAEEWSRANGAKEMLAGTLDENKPANRFLRRHGYAVEHHTLSSRLDLAAFDEAATPFAGVVDEVKAGGIRFFTYPEKAGDETKRRLYELYKITDLDTPGYLGTDPDLYPPYERWHEEIFGSEETVLDGFIIAADGDRYIGLTILQRTGSEGGLYTEYTGVLREYRGRKIGLALKLLSVRFAREFGAPYMTTRNSAFNGAMLAVNQKMGYVKTGGQQWWVKPL